MFRAVSQLLKGSGKRVVVPKFGSDVAAAASAIGIVSKKSQGGMKQLTNQIISSNSPTATFATTTTATAATAAAINTSLRLTRKRRAQSKNWQPLGKKKKGEEGKGMVMKKSSSTSPKAVSSNTTQKKNTKKKNVADDATAANVINGKAAVKSIRQGSSLVGFRRGGGGGTNGGVRKVAAGDQRRFYTSTPTSPTEATTSAPPPPSAANGLKKERKKGLPKKSSKKKVANDAQDTNVVADAAEVVPASPQQTKGVPKKARVTKSAVQPTPSQAARSVPTTTAAATASPQQLPTTIKATKTTATVPPAADTFEAAFQAEIDKAREEALNRRLRKRDAKKILQQTLEAQRKVREDGGRASLVVAIARAKRELGEGSSGTSDNVAIDDDDAAKRTADAIIRKQKEKQMKCKGLGSRLNKNYYFRKARDFDAEVRIARERMELKMKALEEARRARVDAAATTATPPITATTATSGDVPSGGESTTVPSSQSEAPKKDGPL